MRLSRHIILALLPLSLAACGPGGLSKAQGGTAIGAIAGGILGNQVGKGSGRVAATVAGALIGGIVGSEIGRSLDEADRRAAVDAEYRALEYGQSGVATPWNNPDNGHRGDVIPGKPYKLRDAHCRQYTHTIYIDGRPQTMRGRACRRNDGSWRKVA